MGSLYSRQIPCVSAKDTETPVSDHSVNRFPETEQEATSEYIQILKEMEYRSVRAAKMAYVHSDEFERKHTYLTGLVSLAAGMSTYSLQVIRKPATMGMPVFFRIGSITLAVTSGFGIGFYQSYETLLPLFYQKHINYNRAGARWQALEFKLRIFRATSLQGKESLKDLRKYGFKFADERREICEIARPSVQVHDKYEKGSDELLNVKSNNLEAVKRYHEVGKNKLTELTVQNIETEKPATKKHQSII